MTAQLSTRPAAQTPSEQQLGHVTRGSRAEPNHDPFARACTSRERGSKVRTNWANDGGLETNKPLNLGDGRNTLPPAAGAPGGRVVSWPAWSTSGCLEWTVTLCSMVVAGVAPEQADLWLALPWMVVVEKQDASVPTDLHVQRQSSCGHGSTREASPASLCRASRCRIIGWRI